MSKGTIRFSADKTIDSFENEKWNIGDVYEIEFFDEMLTKVFLIDANSDIKKYTDIILRESVVFIDFAFSKKDNPPIIFISICCSAGVYIFRQIQKKPNEQLKQFLMNRDTSFVGKKIRDVFSCLKKFFGKDFYFNYDDIILSRLPNNQLKFYDIILKYAGTPKIDIIKFPTDWMQPILSMKQVILAAFEVYALSLCYPNLPPKMKDNQAEQQITDKGEIKIQSKSIPDNIKNKPFNIGDFYRIKFYSNDLTSIYLFDANLDIQKYLDILSNDPIIFVDFEHVPKTMNFKGTMPIISLFAFYCSSGAFLFKQTKEEPNQQLINFMRKESGHKFIGFDVSTYIGLLKLMFGESFEIDIEDISQTRLQKENDLFTVFKKYAGRSSVLINNKITKTNWNRNNLTIEQVLYASYVVYSLFRSYSNLPKNQNQNKNISKSLGKIQFTSETPLSSFAKKIWSVGQSAEIEFFPNKFTPVYLLNASSDLKKYIPIISQDSVIFIDFEYVPIKQRASPVCLFQFCCSSGAYLFRQRKWEKMKVMNDFLSNKDLKFVAKGVSGDLGRLKMIFGKNFTMNIEDVEQTRLYPYDESANFEKMVDKFAGTPTAQFKDKKISCSNWNAENLEMIQVIYSAFDVVALYNCYPNYLPARLIPYHIPQEKDREPQGDIKEILVEFATSKKYVTKEQLSSPEIIDSFLDSNPSLIAKYLNIDMNLLQDVIMNGMGVNVGHKFKCNKCNKSPKFLFFRHLIGHYKKFHFKNQKSRNHDDDDEEEEMLSLKTLFLHYLNNSGQASLDDRYCFLCMEKFETIENLCDHCWINHYQMLGELTLRAKKTEIYDKHEKTKNSDDDDINDHYKKDDEEEENNNDMAINNDDDDINDDDYD